jgi:hypothetical protein
VREHTTTDRSSDLRRRVKGSRNGVFDQGERALANTRYEFFRTDSDTLCRLVEEVDNSCAQGLHEADWIAEHVSRANDFVNLLQCLVFEMQQEGVGKHLFCKQLILQLDSVQSNRRIVDVNNQLLWNTQQYVCEGRSDNNMINPKLGNVVQTVLFT